MKKLVKRKKQFNELNINGKTIKVNCDGTCVLCNGVPVPIHIQKLNNRSYKAVSISNVRYYVHRFVAMAWLGMPDDPAKNKVHIKDGDYNNIHYSNLMWVSASELTIISDYNYYKKHGKKKPSPSLQNSKIPEEDVPAIFERLRNGETLKAVAKDYDTSDMSISRLKKRFPEEWAESLSNKAEA